MLYPCFSKDSVANILFTSVTSPAYSFGNAVSENLGLVLGLGRGSHPAESDM